MSNLYKTTLVTALLGQECLNVFYYYDKNGTWTADQVCWAFGNLLAPYIAAICTNDTDFLEIRAEELLQGNGYGIMPFAPGTHGVFGDQSLPAHDVTAFQTQPASRTFRTGRKSFSGIHAPAIVDGQPSPNFAAALDACAQALPTMFSLAGDLLFPVLAREIGGGTAYLLTQVLVAIFKRKSTQNSRKQYTNPGGSGGISFPYTTVLSPTVNEPTVAVDKTVTVGFWGWTQTAPYTITMVAPDAQNPETLLATEPVA